MAVVDEVARIITSTLDIGEVYEQFALEVNKLVDSDWAAISLFDTVQDSYTVPYRWPQDASYFSPGQTYPLEGSFVSVILKTGRTVIWEDITELENEFWSAQYLLKEGRRSMIKVPLTSRGNVLGVFSLISNLPGAYGAHEQRIVERLANQIAPAVENSMLHQGLQNSIEEMAVVDEVARIITSTLDIDEVYEQFALEVNKLVDSDWAVITLFNTIQASFTVPYCWPKDVSYFAPGQTFPLKGSYNNATLTTQRTLIWEAGQDSELWSIQQMVKEGRRSMISVPLSSRGKVLGCFSLVSNLYNTYGAREQRIVERLASQIAPAIDNSRLFWEVQQQSLALASLGESVNFVDLEGNLQFVNKSFEKLYGYTPDEVLGRSVELLIPAEADNAGEVRRVMEKALQEIWRGETNRVRKNGEEFPVFLTVAPVRDSTGQVLGFVGVTRDLTESKRAEEAVHESQELYRSLVDNSVLGLGIYAPGEALKLGNQRLSQIIGHTKEEYESPEFNYMDLFLSEDQKLIADNTRKRLAGEDIAPYEVRLIPKGKEIKWVEVHNVFVRYRGRDAMQVQLLDVTDRKLAEERVRDASRLASIGELAAGVAHEINNPLTSVLGFSQLLMAEDLPTEVRSDLQIVFSNAQRAAKIVQNLLSFATKREFRKQYVNLTSILERALDIKSYDLTTSNIRVTQELSPHLPPTMVDEHQLVQVILNLLTNAEQAIRVSNRKGQIRVRATSTESLIRISIIDDGPGIPPELLGKVFEPFFTTSGVGEGTGLGLSICYGIVRQHDGTLWAESIPGEGAAFHIELPIVSPEDREDLEPSECQPQQIAAATKHLLVVDDEPHIRDLLVRSLELEKYTVDLAKEGGEAWRKFQARRYDCILLDLKMPGMNGQELFRRIEESDPELAKRVIFITGDTISPVTRNFLSANHNPVLSKPLDIELLGRQVGELLQGANKHG